MTKRPGWDVKANEGIPTTPWWIDSPYWEKNAWAIHDVSFGMLRGIRLNSLALGVRLPGIHTLLSTGRDDGLLPGFHQSIMTTASPPSSIVLDVWFRINQQERIKDPTTNPAGNPLYELGHAFLAYLTFSDYRILYHYLKANMVMDGDESAWATVSQGIPPKTTADIQRLANVFATSYALAGVYSQICQRFNYPRITSISPTAWKHQDHVRLIKSEEDYSFAIRHLCTFLESPPHSPIPTEGQFRFRWIGYLTTGNVLVMDLGTLAFFQPNVTSVASLYKNHYPSWAKHTEYLLTEALLNSWRAFLGGDPNIPYSSLEDKWGIHKPPVIIQGADVTLSQRDTLAYPFQPSPTHDMLQDMMAFDKHFENGDHAFLSTQWILRIHTFFASLRPNPLSFSYNPQEQLKALQNQNSTEVAGLWFTTFCRAYYPYVAFMKTKTKGWKDLPSASWDQYGLTEQERKNRAANIGPFSDKYARDTWPQPWLLPKEDLLAYLAYMAQEQSDGYPKFREARLFEVGKDLTEYHKRVQHSKQDYDEWKKTMVTYQAALEKHAVGDFFTATVEEDGKKKTKQVYNWFSDYDVWDDHATDTQKNVAAFWSPWKELTGHTFVQEVARTLLELVEYARQVFDILLDVLAKSLKVVTDAGKDAALPFAIIGGTIIAGLYVVGNMNKK